MMESRKVQLAGGSTFTVSLPKAWAREHGVDAGSELLLQTHGDGTLLVQVDPGNGESARPAVDVDRHDGVPLDALATALYAAGHDEFALVGERAIRPETVRTVEAATADLVGLAVVQTGDRAVVLRNALDQSDVSLPQTVMQLRRTACGMFEDTAGAVLEGDPKAADRVVGRDAGVDRLFGVVARSFRRSLVDMREVDRLGVDRPGLFDLYRAARALERTGDDAAALCRTVGGHDDAVAHALSEPLAVHAREAVGVLDDATVALLESDGLEAVPDLFERLDALREDAVDLQRRLDEAGITCGQPPARLLRRTSSVVDGAAVVAEAALQDALRDQG